MADVTAYPIIFSAPMVRAILDGRKTQTRRLAFDAPHIFIQTGDELPESIIPRSLWYRRYEKFQAGERPWLWVKENFGLIGRALSDGPPDESETTLYRATDTFPDHCIKWRPSIHMPRWASRLSLEVTDMRIERLQDISEEDARAEGIVMPYKAGNFERDLPIRKFRDLWNSIHGPDAWDQNPEIVAVSFEIHKVNIGSDPT